MRLDSQKQVVCLKDGSLKKWPDRYVFGIS